jgi:5'-nucleotidase
MREGRPRRASGLRDYGRLKLDKRTDPRGFDYFWFGLASVPQTPAHETDLEAVADGYVSVTPLHLDLTHHASLDRLKGAYREWSGAGRGRGS